MKLKNTIEKITCDAILQNPIAITVCGKEYHVAPPSTATLIEVSKYISQLPELNINKDGNVVMETLSIAKDCEALGDIVAILILGKKNLITEKKRLFGLIKYKVDNQKKLAGEILLNLSTEELNDLFVKLLNLLKVDFFFDITIFLKDVNMLKKTKMSETTASGQP
ncbi:MAG: hypothetical protein LBK94_00755 [Prevotellaceae bacterium]|jgi:hypothetical protein|nr:hypothetical protein [Prevotellaceae bacterium]